MPSKGNANHLFFFPLSLKFWFPRYLLHCWCLVAKVHMNVFMQSKYREIIEKYIYMRSTISRSLHCGQRLQQHIAFDYVDMTFWFPAIKGITDYKDIILRNT